MQGIFSPVTIKKILVAGIIEEKAQRVIANELAITLKTVNRYLKIAKEQNITAEDIKKLSENRLIKKIEKRFDGEKLKRVKSVDKFLSKSLLKESAIKIAKGGSFNSCYLDYINEAREKDHYSKDYYRLILRKYILNEFEKKFRVSEIWKREDVMYFSFLVGDKFSKLIKEVFDSKYISEKEAIRKCMRLINFISGDRKVYEFLNGKLEEKKLSFSDLWKEVIFFKKSATSKKKWDTRFFDYKDKMISDFKKNELSKIYKE